MQYRETCQAWVLGRGHCELSFAGGTQLCLHPCVCASLRKVVCVCACLSVCVCPGMLHIQLQEIWKDESKAEEVPGMKEEWESSFQ